MSQVKQRITLLLAAALASGCSNPSAPEPGEVPLQAGKFFSGNELLLSCKYAEENRIEADDPLKFNIAKRTCNQYIAGVADLASATMAERVCFDRVQFSQLRSVVVKYLETRPQLLHNSAAVLTYNSLQDAFPCKP